MGSGPELRICIDVDELERGIAFYTAAFRLRVGRRLGSAWAAGARQEGAVQEQAWGRMANLADPFGHGFCLLQLKGRGYDALAEPAP
ncbi:hypothetical protein FGE12_27740 [Aggregicoccus sp. 17bor-14]|uniref:VOC family protein n=1 Tax=Myxococcaceae TaxID=31 RepID=UPI00129CE78F|nr:MULTISPECIES: VOC family protein [Myxococcaceae]MBF5046240.1 hypothetical protein [Simulacricoccus sp. 17bor-14]MRI91963.1 hypothetical protein [Aggregicoccus sp. 17bor-14]